MSITHPFAQQRIFEYLRQRPRTYLRAISPNFIGIEQRITFNFCHVVDIFDQTHACVDVSLILQKMIDGRGVFNVDTMSHGRNDQYPKNLPRINQHDFIAFLIVQ